MKINIKQSSKYKTKHDNLYFDLTINGITHEHLERSKLRHLLEIVDSAIGV